MPRPVQSRIGIWFTGVCLLATMLFPCACNLEHSEGIISAAGSFGDLAVVISSESLRAGAQTFLNRLNQPVSFVIREERPFSIDIYGPDKWKLSRNYKNILWLVDWNDGGSLVKEVRSRLDDETAARVGSGQERLVQFQDPYARYQHAILVVANDRNELMSYLNRNLVRVQRLLEESVTSRLIKRNRREGIHEQLRDKYWQIHGFSIDIPITYRENQVEPDGQTVIEWMRNGPSRGITVSWDKRVEPERLLQDREALLTFRRQMGELVHDEDLVELSFAWQDTMLAEFPCVKLTGAWAGRGFNGGGPFWSFFLADPERGRLYCLDLLTFSPGQDKMNYFREMHAIASTFSWQQPPR
ncbi:MAG: DUF4837 family protein [bacterium]